MKIFFSVGEPCGPTWVESDSAQGKNPDVECVGFGGPKMKEAGLDQHFI